ncbi:MAG: glycosyltransferase [Prevotella sp.]|nr:glycosyltransferase [Prevotella sp.]
MIDWLLFVIVAFTVAYLLIFSVAALFRHRNEIKRSKIQNRYIVLIPSYKQDSVILQTVNSALGQTYPQRMFDVVVISDHQQEITNMRLAQLPITLLTPDFDRSSKAKSLQYAVLNLPQFKIYDAVLILDAGNIVKPEYLEEVNDAYSSAGTKCLQTHRLSRNRDTSSARLDSIFEEINNSIFRRGHQVLGLSSSLNGSGMVFDFDWFKRNIMKVRDSVGEDKALEAMLMRDNIYIDYFEDIYVYDEKTRQIREFNDQRSRWIYTQLHAAVSNLRYLPSALLNRQYDHIDKIVQWLLIPRTILIGIIAIMSLVLPFIYFSLVVKWWIVAALILLAFSLATPDYLVDEHWDKDFMRAPIVSLGGLLNIFRAGRSEATDRATSVHRWFGRVRKKRKKKRSRK